MSINKNGDGRGRSVSFDYFVGIFLGLCHGYLVHFVDNANYVSLFAMELEKFLVNDKATAF